MVTAILLLMFIALVFLLLLLAVLFIDWGTSAGGTLANGRAIMFHSDSWYLNTIQDADTWIAKTGGRTIVVGPTAVTVDGKRIADIVSGVKIVDVTLRHGRIALVVDGVTIPNDFDAN